MATQPFIAVSLKDTGQVLGVLSRDADETGGTDIAGLAPNGMPVRAPAFYAALAASNPPFEVVVPKELLTSAIVQQDDLGRRRRIFGNPNQSTVNGAIITPTDLVVPPLLPPPAAVNFHASVGGLVAQLDVAISPAAGSAGAVCYVFLTASTGGATPATRAIRTSIPAFAAGANSVDITAAVPAPGITAAGVPIPSGADYFVVIAVAGRPLQTATISVPP